MVTLCVKESTVCVHSENAYLIILTVNKLEYRASALLKLGLKNSVKGEPIGRGACEKLALYYLFLCAEYGKYHFRIILVIEIFGYTVKRGSVTFRTGVIDRYCRTLRVELKRGGLGVVYVGVRALGKLVRHIALCGQSDYCHAVKVIHARAFGCYLHVTVNIGIRRLRDNAIVKINRVLFEGCIKSEGKLVILVIHRKLCVCFLTAYGKRTVRCNSKENTVADCDKRLAFLGQLHSAYLTKQPEILFGSFEFGNNYSLVGNSVYGSNLLFYCLADSLGYSFTAGILRNKAELIISLLDSLGHGILNGCIVNVGWVIELEVTQIPFTRVEHLNNIGFTFAVIKMNLTSSDILAVHINAVSACTRVILNNEAIGFSRLQKRRITQCYILTLVILCSKSYSSIAYLVAPKNDFMGIFILSEEF